MFGWAGKILYINLTNKKIKTEDTKKYIDFLGGRGINQFLLFNYFINFTSYIIRKFNQINSFRVIL